MSILGRKRRRDIRRQRWQFVSVTATVVLGVMLFCASYDAYQNLNASYHGTYDRLRLADIVVTGANDTFADQVAQLPGVKTVEKRIQADVPLRIGGHELIGRVVGMPATGQPTIDRLDVLSGQYLPPNSTNQALAETHLAKTYNLSAGSSVEMLTSSGWHSLPIVGEAVSAEYLWPAPSTQQLFADPQDFGVLFVPEGLVPLAATPAVQHQVLVRYEPGANRAALDSRVRHLADVAGADDVTTQADQPSNKRSHSTCMASSRWRGSSRRCSCSLRGLRRTCCSRASCTRSATRSARFAPTASQAQRCCGTTSATGCGSGLPARVIGVALGVPGGWGITERVHRRAGDPRHDPAVLPAHAAHRRGLWRWGRADRGVGSGPRGGADRSCRGDARHGARRTRRAEPARAPRASAAAPARALADGATRLRAQPSAKPLDGDRHRAGARPRAHIVGHARYD